MLPIPNKRSTATKRLALVAATITTLPLAGCYQTDRIVPSTVPIADYRTRHPIVMAEARASIDVFPSSQQRLDPHTAKQVYAFAEQYSQFGHGPLLILVPRGPYRALNAGALADMRRILSAGGAKAGVTVTTYPVADPHLASAVRLSYTGLKANVADQCGQWPTDVASASSIDGWENKPYWNLGCATQTMIAAQASDPRDLVSPRGEEPADTLTRARGIEAVRKGTDPNTGWTVKNTNIGGVGGS